MSNPYTLQDRTNGVVIRQGRSWITLRQHEMRALVRELQQRLDDPARVEETNIGHVQAAH